MSEVKISDQGPCGIPETTDEEAKDKPSTTTHGDLSLKNSEKKHHETNHQVRPNISILSI